MSKNWLTPSVCATLCAGLLAGAAAGVSASDHGDTPALISGGRHDVRVTDFFALKRGDKLALIIDTNPTLVREPTYVFPTDTTFTANIDNHTQVLQDPLLSPILGGTFADPSTIRENVTFSFNFDANNQVRVTMSSPDTALGISGFYPEQAARGSLVYVLGSGFVAGETEVKVNDRRAPLTFVLSKNLLVFLTPFNATSGKIEIESHDQYIRSASALKVKPFAGIDFSALAVLRTIRNDRATLAKIAAGDVASLAQIGLPVKTFAGLRDDPFVRGPQKNRNIAAMAVEMPLSMFTHGRQKVLVAWGTSNIEADPSSPFGTTPSEEVSGRSFGSMFSPEQTVINNLHPSLQASTALALNLSTVALGGRPIPPDVMIYDTTKPQSFPNGRELNDDIIDLIAPNDTRVERLRAGEAATCAASGDPLDCPTQNDIPHSPDFPYLGVQRF